MVRTNPYTTYNFTVTADGAPLGSFQEVSGLNADGEVIDYRTGDKPENLVDKIPGLRSVANIVLRRGYTQNRDLFEWYMEIAQGNILRRSVTIKLLDEKREGVIFWNCRNCWVNAIEGPSLSATSSQVAVESTTLIHEGITMGTL